MADFVDFYFSKRKFSCMACYSDIRNAGSGCLMCSRCMLECLLQEKASVKAFVFNSLAAFESKLTMFILHFIEDLFQ